MTKCARTLRVCVLKKSAFFPHLLWKNKFCQSGNNVLLNSLLLSFNHYVSAQREAFTIPLLIPLPIYLPVEFCESPTCKLKRRSPRETLLIVPLSSVAAHVNNNKRRQTPGMFPINKAPLHWPSLTCPYCSH